jgi:hypothetical protein
MPFISDERPRPTIVLRLLARASIVAIAVAVGPSCSTMAAIERGNGPTLEARIDGSDSDRLYVTDGQNTRYAVFRSDIVAIDHPGRAGMLTGTILLGGGAAAFALAPAIEHYEDKSGWRWDLVSVFYGVCLVAAGLPPLLYGLATRMRSQEAARVRTQAPVPPSRELPRLSCPSCQ